MIYLILKGYAKFPNIRKVYLLDRLFPSDDNKDFVVNIKYAHNSFVVIKSIDHYMLKIIINLQK